jgi:hypothetical protein
VEVQEIQDLSGDSIFALAYGQSGVGKTHFIATLGELGRVLLVDVDKGALTVKYAPDLKKYHPNITIVSFDQFKDLDELYKLVQANDPAKWSAALSKSSGKTVEITEPFDWIAYDTWSEAQWFMHQELRRDKGILGVGLNFRKNLEIQHWGGLTDLNKLAVEAFRDCKVNQIFSMQEAITKDEISGQITGGPAIHGKLVQEFPAYFNVVVYMYNDVQGKYIATTKPKGRFPAKTRIGVGQDYINPTAKQIFTLPV